MANWSKRTTQTFKGSKNRITRTNSSKGTSTYSSSKKVGNTRTTQSTNSSNGKIKVYTTESHPTLGTKRTVKTLNPTIRYKKPKAPRKPRAKKYKPSSGSYTNYTNYNNEPSFLGSMWSEYFWWWVIGGSLLLFGATWYIWLFFISAFLKLEVDFFK